ncbi:hypothetical protein ACFORL_04615 [Legionella dresdenensis]|uniref:Uncharacterized protein n=1 Tax=Legionella dresdenensis TaxID=450200 RepID=A0ABV8CDW7_9GAMM
MVLSYEEIMQDPYEKLIATDGGLAENAPALDALEPAKQDALAEELVKQCSHANFQQLHGKLKAAAPYVNIYRALENACIVRAQIAAINGSAKHVATAEQFVANIKTEAFRQFPELAKHFFAKHEAEYAENVAMTLADNKAARAELKNVANDTFAGTTFGTRLAQATKASKHVNALLQDNPEKIVKRNSFTGELVNLFPRLFGKLKGQEQAIAGKLSATEEAKIKLQTITAAIDAEDHEEVKQSFGIMHAALVKRSGSEETTTIGADSVPVTTSTEPADKPASETTISEPTPEAAAETTSATPASETAPEAATETTSATPASEPAPEAATETTSATSAAQPVPEAAAETTSATPAAAPAAAAETTSATSAAQPAPEAATETASATSAPATTELPAESSPGNNTNSIFGAANPTNQKRLGNPGQKTVCGLNPGSSCSVM